MKKIWSESEIEYLINNYTLTKTNELMNNLKGKTLDQIRYKANSLGLYKQVTKSKKDISFLENLNDPETCYWWGFLMADGCFNKKQLILTVSLKDINHLEIFAKKTNSKISTSFQINSYNPLGHHMCRIAINDKFLIPKLLNRFKILSKKTYNPPDISEFLHRECLHYFLVGLIDGDGHISNTQYLISIKLHPNWKSVLNDISYHLNENYNIYSYISSKNGWTVLNITKKANLQKLKKLIKFKVPYMERKWIRIPD